MNRTTIMTMINLDANATTRPHPDVIEAVNQGLESLWENPSSTHRPGQAVRRALDHARKDVAALLGCAPDEIIMTSGGTEADMLALSGVLESCPQRRVLVSTAIEHPAVRDLLPVIRTRYEGLTIVELPVDGNGLVSPDALKEILAAEAGRIALVSIMWANNETGVIQPVTELAGLCREHGVLFHSDAVQWVGKMPLDLGSIPIDLLSFSAHKFHGPKGVGGLCVRSGVHLQSQVPGGHQEGGLRGGTENVPGILGLAAAARAAQVWLAGDGMARQRALRDMFESRLSDGIPSIRIHGAEVERLWNTSSVAFPGLDAGTMLLYLSERGVCAAAGAACASGSIEPSPVLLGMGMDPALAGATVRFSLSTLTTQAEVESGAEIVIETARELYDSSG